MTAFINDTQFGRHGTGFDEQTLTALWSTVVAIYCFGGMIGAMAVGTVADVWGRKRGLMLNNVLVLVAVLLLAFSKTAKSYEMLVVGRFIVGINSGLNAGLAPMYVTEISPVASRGSLGSCYQLVITISILISQILGLPSVLGSEKLWPLLLALIALPGVLQVVLLLFTPESPKFLLLRHKNTQGAADALRWLRQTDDVGAELQALQAEVEASLQMQELRTVDLVRRRNLRRPLIVAVGVMLAQQLSGINAVIFYSTKIFQVAGLSQDASHSATMGMGAVNVAVTVFSIWLVERFGRRPLLIGGLAGLVVDTLLLTLCLAFKASAEWIPYTSIFLVFTFIIVFATGMGSIPWFLVTELFDQQSRGRATSVAVAINWSANFAVSVSFLPIQKAIDFWVFLIFAALLFGFLVFAFFLVPETKGKTIEEIQQDVALSPRPTLGLGSPRLNSGTSRQELTHSIESVSSEVDRKPD